MCAALASDTHRPAASPPSSASGYARLLGEKIMRTSPRASGTPPILGNSERRPWAKASVAALSSARVITFGEEESMKAAVVGGWSFQWV